MSGAAMKVLFVGHEASRTGAPVGFLSLMRWWQAQGAVSPRVWLRRGGPLLEEHRVLGEVAVGTQAEALSPLLAEGVHLAYLNTATLGGFARVLRRAGVPVICHAHEMDHELGLTGKANLEALADSVTRFVACSRAVRDSLRRCAGVPEEKIVVVPECVDVERALRLAEEGGGQDARGPLTARDGRPPTAGEGCSPLRVVCGMGTVGWRKGTDLFLRVLAELGADWQGVWIGDLQASPEAERLRHDLRALGLEGRMRFTGSLANPFAVLRQAEVFCLTSREDPYPLAMVEAAALGLPVVGFRGSGGVEEFAAAGGAVLADYADTRGMAALARAAAGNAAGAALARQLCAPEVVGMSLLAVMRETALAEAARLGTNDVAALAAVAAETQRMRVECLQADSGIRHERVWEGPAGGVCELLFEHGVAAGGFEITLQPVARSAVISGVEVFVESEDGVARGVAAETRSASRAVRLGKEDGGVWLLLDGQGRLLLRGQCSSEAVALGVRWRLSVDVKAELAARLREPEAVTAPSFLRRLGLK